MKKAVIFLVCFASLLFFQAQSWAVPVNLNDFYADQSVTVALDGSSAILAEDSSLASVLLSNDPGCGEPGIDISLDAMSITFDYDFAEGIDSADEFYAWLFDPSTYSVLEDSDGNPLEFWTEDTGSGTVTWNLLGTSLLGSNVGMGMEFQLNVLPGDIGTDSLVTVSNVNINPVPEPATLFLVGSGLASLFLARRKKPKIQKNQMTY